MILSRQSYSACREGPDHPPSLRPDPSPPPPPLRLYYRHHHLKPRSLRHTVLVLLGLITGLAVLGLYHCMWIIHSSPSAPSPALVVTSPATVHAKLMVPTTTTTTVSDTTSLPFSVHAIPSGDWFDACLLNPTTVWQEWQACLITHLATNEGQHNIDFQQLISTPRASYPWASSNHTAVLLEFRAWERELLFSVNNVLINLPVHWRIQIVGGPAIIGLAHQLFRFYIQAGKIVLTNLGYDNMGQGRISQILTNLNFYEQLLGDTWLFFQYDSTICSQQRHLLASFIEQEYGWWGAPWRHWKRLPHFGGNGGFSLRRRAFVTNILTLFPWANQTEIDNEDWYMCNMAADLYVQNRTALLQAPNLLPAPLDKAKQFSAEMYYYEKPFGVHAFWRNMPANATQLKAFLETCPEAWELLPVNVLKKRREWRSVLCAEEGVSKEEKRRRRYWKKCMRKGWRRAWRGFIEKDSGVI